MSNLQEAIKRAQAWSDMGRPVTVEANGKDVFTGVLENAQDELTELINEHKPSVLKIWYLLQNGYRDGNQRWKKGNMPVHFAVVENPAAGMAGFEAPADSIEDAKVEEENGKPVKPSSPLAPQAASSIISTQGLTVDGFAYQMTAAQLAEAKARIQILEKENRDYERDIVSKDRKILELEHENDSLNEKLESNEGLSGIMKNPDTLGTILTNLPSIMSALRGGGGMSGAGAHPVAVQLSQYIGQLPEELQGEAINVIESMLAMALQGNTTVFARVETLLVAQQSQSANGTNGGSQAKQDKVFS